MADQTDVYLGRCLKNWAEREKSHARSKESLLRIAATQSKIDSTPAVFSQDRFEEYRSYRQSAFYAGMYMRGSFTISLGWSVDLSTLLRVVQ